jgi:hypothetical protein
MAREEFEIKIDERYPNGLTNPGLTKRLGEVRRLMKIDQFGEMDLDRFVTDTSERLCKHQDLPDSSPP